MHRALFWVRESHYHNQQDVMHLCAKVAPALCSAEVFASSCNGGLSCWLAQRMKSPSSDAARRRAGSRFPCHAGSVHNGYESTHTLNPDEVLAGAAHEESIVGGGHGGGEGRTAALHAIHPARSRRPQGLRRRNHQKDRRCVLYRSLRCNILA